MKRFFLTLFQVFVLAPVFVIFTIIVASVTTIGGLLLGEKYFGYYPGHIWGKVCCYLALCRVTVKGRENIDSKTSYIFMANHQGAFDIFLIYGFLGHDFRWIMKEGIRKLPFVGRACAAIGHIFVNERSAHSIKHTLDAAKESLREGKSITLFPEGSRTLTGHMDKFRRGGFLIAMELGLPIVPITIEGSYEACKRGTLKISPSHLKLTIHKPIETKNLTPEEMPKLMEEVRKEIASALPENRR